MVTKTKINNTSDNIIVNDSSDSEIRVTKGDYQVKAMEHVSYFIDDTKNNNYTDDGFNINDANDIINSMPNNSTKNGPQSNGLESKDDQIMNDKIIATNWQENQNDLKQITAGNTNLTDMQTKGNNTNNISINNQIQNDRLISINVIHNQNEIHNVTKGQLSSNDWLTKK